MPRSSMSRTLEYLRNEGWDCEIVEHYNSHARIRQDLYGFADILATKPNRIALVQACLRDFQPHVDKILGERAKVAQRWLKAGGELYLIGWRQIKVKRGGKAKVWKERIRKFELSDFAHITELDRLDDLFDI